MGTLIRLKTPILGPDDRAELARYLRALRIEIGADGFVAGQRKAAQADGSVELLTSDWPFDHAISDGATTLARLAGSAGCALPGRAASVQFLDGYAAPFALGHRYEIDGSEFIVAYTCNAAPHFRTERSVSVQMRALYQLCGLVRRQRQAPTASSLSDRERDCLRWVAEGKTTDEVAVILGVSANTVNNYIASAIPKVSAKNRAMAVANAIRTGMI